MRPETIPTLKGKAAREFEKKISEPSAAQDEMILRQAEEVYRAIKKTS